MSNGSKDNLTWLTHWYAAQCNGDWEHVYGVEIDICDNPGWVVRIDLKDTKFAGRESDLMTSNLNDSDGDTSQRWYRCQIIGNRFEGAGGVHDLSTIIEIFREWVNRNEEI